jgi:hypothetical protein
VSIDAVTIARYKVDENVEIACPASRLGMIGFVLALNHLIPYGVESRALERGEERHPSARFAVGVAKNEVTFWT